MDAKLINPFLISVSSVLPQLGFQNIEKKSIELRNKKISVDGVIIIIGVVGELKGNIAYSMDMEGAKKIASTMMMGMPVESLDDMAKSAISELSNMLTANASINLANEDISVDISVPTLMYGDSIEVNMNEDQIICIHFDVDGILFSVDIGLHKS